MTIFCSISGILDGAIQSEEVIYGAEDISALQQAVLGAAAFLNKLSGKYRTEHVLFPSQLRRVPDTAVLDPSGNSVASISDSTVGEYGGEVKGEGERGGEGVEGPHSSSLFAQDATSTSTTINVNEERVRQTNGTLHKDSIKEVDVEVNQLLRFAPSFPSGYDRTHTQTDSSHLAAHLERKGVLLERSIPAKMENTGNKSFVDRNVRDLWRIDQRNSILDKARARDNNMIARPSSSVSRGTVCLDLLTAALH